MKIECLLKRKGGTSVVLDNIVYRFVETDASGGAHIAEVSNNVHAQRFLDIDKAYRIYGNKAQPVVKGERPPSEGGSENGADGDELCEEAVETEETLMELTNAELAERYKAKFGEDPKARMTKAMLVEALLDLQSE